jgi:hypothetical protein
MTRRKIKNFEISKYKNNKLLKFTRRNKNTPFSPLAKLDIMFFLRTFKMTRKIEHFRTSK